MEPPRHLLRHVDPPLLAALAVTAGRPDALAVELAPDPTNPLDPTGGWTAGTLRAATASARSLLGAFRPDGVRTSSEHPGGLRRGDALVSDALDWLLGPVPEAEQPMWREELGAEPDARAPSATVRRADGRPLSVLVVGAGMSGLLAAHRLGQAGVDCVLVERDAGVGGTWRANSYPGCRVDVPSHLFSYSFAQRGDWPAHYSDQGALLEYFEGFAREAGLLDHLRARTRLVSAHFDESASQWEVELATTSGPELDAFIGPLDRAAGDHANAAPARLANPGPRRLRVDALVLAPGQLSRPLLPALPGRERFASASWHSARWRHDVDLAGKVVGVVGSAASALQLVPEVARVARRVVVFQRTPNWIAPTPEYRAPFAPEKQWLFRHVPGYAGWYRLWLLRRNGDALLPTVLADPDWDGGPASTSAANDLLRATLTGALESQLGDDPGLLRRLLPAYPPGAKRILRDDGTWVATLRQPHVELVTEPIVEVTARGIRTAAGEVPLDHVVYATGFAASDMLGDVELVGRDGARLAEAWQGDPRAHLGVLVPNFPNCFLLYGPNTNLVQNGSIIFMAECATNYVLSCLETLTAERARSLAVRPEVATAFAAEVDEGNARRTWGAGGVPTWYRSPSGRISQNWPFRLADYWARTRVVDSHELLLGR